MIRLMKNTYGQKKMLKILINDEKLNYLIDYFRYSN